MPSVSNARLIALFLIFASVQSVYWASVVAQEPPPPPKRSTAPEKSKAAESKPADYSKEAIVIEQMKTVYRFEKDGTGQRELSLRARIQSDAGVEGFGQLVFGYNSANENLDIDKVSVRKQDGTVVNASASNVQDLTAPITREAPVYTDLRQKHVTVPGLRPGDVLEYHMVWKVNTPLAQNQFWLDHNFVVKNLIVLDEQLEVSTPVESNAKLKTEPGFEPAIKNESGRKIFTWKHANLKRDDEDEDKEESSSKKKRSDEPKRPDVQMSTFQSWAEIGQWYAGLERDRIVPDDKIREKVAEQLKGITNDADKVRLLYEYVAKNYRYVSLSLGQARYQPHAAPEVFANLYGDCKDKHTLLAAMLSAAGLHAYPALMNSARKIDADMPSPGQFDHVITAVPLGKEILWMDTTSEIAPFRLLTPPLRKKQALLIPTGAPARLEMTPANPPFQTSELVEVQGEVDDLGKLIGHSQITLRGDAELFFRIMFRRAPKSQWDKVGQYVASLTGLSGTVTGVSPSDPTATDLPFKVEFSVSKDGFLDWSSKKIKLDLPLPSLRLPAGDADYDENSKPIEIGTPGEMIYRLKLTLPSKYQARVPVPVSVTRDYAEYASSYKLDGNTFTAERKFRLREREIPVDRTQDYIAFRSSAQADEAQNLLLETSVVGSPAIPDSAKVSDLVEAARTATENQNYPLAEQLLKRAVEKEPKHREVRRQLGWVLFSQRKYDSAVEVLREQTKMNPFDDYSYNLLGRVFWVQQKFEDADASFRKQIEISPLDKFAHGNLGQMYVEWRKYKEAVPELEKAISLNPENEFLQISLGRAYLNLGETAKATEAFDQASKLAPGPPVWNDVAYNLSVHKVALDRAEQYAESAVTAMATGLRNVELTRLTMQDLASVASIGAYWDTLGWVEYQRGNVDLADKYITAAWQLNQHSEVGYHLGQILEKRGKNAEAVKIYALASAADRLYPEARESLARLGGKDKVDSYLNKAQQELLEMRTIKLPSSLKNEKESATAEFYVVLTPGTAQSAQVAEVKFIRGNQKLEQMAPALKAARYNLSFPNENSTRLIRRGTLTCKPGDGECSFVMYNPEEIVSLD